MEESSSWSSPVKKSKSLTRNVFSSGLVALSTLVIVMLPTASRSQSNPIDLTGTWIGKGYACEKGGLTEKIQISINGNYLVAKKLTGDNCVPAGNITFQGTLPDSLSRGSSFPITVVVGNPTNPASGKTSTQLKILDANSFSVGISASELVTFRRR